MHFILYPNQLSLYSDLGRTATLFDISDGEGLTTFWISYWKDLKGLQAFATSSAHRIGQDAYIAKKFPYMGVMHETYHSPKGSWETVYDNVPPLGLGESKLSIYVALGRFLLLTTAPFLQEKPKT